MVKEEYRYSFPEVQGTGKTWHMTHKIHKLLGIRPTGRHDTEGQTVIIFDSELTDMQISTLTEFLKRPDVYGPVFEGFMSDPSNSLFITDIFDKDKDFDEWLSSTRIPGLDGVRFFVEKVEGSGNNNGIIIRFNKPLSQGEKNRILEAYADVAKFGGF
jgi:hypothetical protein